MNTFKKIKKYLLEKLASLNLRRKVYARKTYLFIQKKPYTSFFAVLIIFLILMIVGNVFFSPKPEAQKKLTAPKVVQIYKIGSASEVSFQGKVEKSGVVKIFAQMPGIVSNINVYEGQQIEAGTNILSLSTNYSGGNSMSLAKQIAQTQYQNTKDTYDNQKKLIQAQRDLANKNKDNLDQLRDISNKTTNDTQNLINLDQSIVDILNQNLSGLNSSDPLYLQTKEQIAQFQSAVVQLTGSLRGLQYQGAGDKPPADLANMQKDVVIRGLDIQEKALDMSLEISRLSYNMALINESSMYPSTPISGVVNKIFVHIGDNVSSGSLLANITGNNQHVEIVVQVPADIAKNISNFEPSTLYIGNKSIQLMPTFVSKDATNGVLYSIIYELDDSFAAGLTDSTYIDVKIPVGVADTTNIDPFIPLDSVLQTQEEAYVYVVENEVAKVKKITLGQIQGKYVEALSGIPKNASLILSRNVVEGDRVQIEK